MNYPLFKQMLRTAETWAKENQNKLSPHSPYRKISNQVMTRTIKVDAFARLLKRIDSIYEQY